MDGIITDRTYDNIKLNQVKIGYHYYDYPNYEDLFELNLGWSDHGMRAYTEYNISNRNDIITDKTYNPTDRFKILEVYKNTGIDIRLLPDVKTEIMSKVYTVRNMDEVELEEVTDILINRYTIEELQYYRGQSNLFRRNDKTKNLTR